MAAIRQRPGMGRGPVGLVLGGRVHEGRGRQWAVAVLIVSAITLASCTSSSLGPTSSTTTVPPQAKAARVSLYWLRDGAVLGVSHRRVVATRHPLEQVALSLLLSGPSGLEKRAGLSSAIPARSQLLGLSVTRGVATADFNASFASGAGSFSVRARVAQVLYTLTSFSGINAVRFEVNGALARVFSSEGLVLDHPITPSEERDLLPAILVQDPAVGDTVHSPLVVAGLANTFEATLEIELLDASGQVLLRRSLMASQGTGSWGSFAGRYRFVLAHGQAGHLLAYERSAKDGSKIHVVSVPILLARSP